ncbi:helix-turn-helix domain-containing protein [Bacteroidales bacterium OttesenSCG-928-C19]|nr:helix-turn-helix domain-containing protein [Bacteroidales bacterium OttesenSCG-928-C19]
MKYLSLKYYLSLFLILLVYNSHAFVRNKISPDGSNPLLDLVGKPFSEYHDTYMPFSSNMLHKDSISRAELIRFADEAAAVDNTGEWNFISDMIKYTVRFYESRDGGFVWDSDYTAENYSEDMLSLAERAEKKGFRLIRIWGLYYAAEGYRIFTHDYKRSFTYYLEAAAELETTSTKDFPPRPHIYNQIAGLYYTFREYNDAIIFYNKIIDDPYSKENYYKSYYPALNGLGLCYRYGNEDYERSDSCFMQLLEETRSVERDRKVWEGIAEGNIGYNYYLRKNYDVALSWLIPAIGKITRPNDFAFLSLRAVDVADIYLKKERLNFAKKYIDIALDHHYKTRVPEKNSRLYDVLVRYYTSIGNNRMANSYLDSTLLAKDKENEAFSGLVLRRVEQQLRAADQKIHEQKFNAEQTKSHTYRRMVIIVSTALVAILVLLGFTLFFYRRKRNAYRELIRRSQSWAGMEVQKEPAINDTEIEYNLNDNGNIAPEAANVSEENEKIIMDEFNNLMQTEKLYRKPDLTLPEVADKLNTNRTYLSKTINAFEKKSFTTYINELRIKDAVILLSNPQNMKYSIDYIADEVGFTNRTTFSQVFKKVTGISPTEFRRNKI